MRLDIPSAGPMVGPSSLVAPRTFPETGPALDAVLGAVLAGESVPMVLDRLARAVEGLAPGMLCTVLFLEEGRLRHGAAPSVSPEYVQAIDGIAIGPEVGSCGTAAFWGKTVVVSEIASDPKWDIARDLALRAGLAACWSTPIWGAGGQVVGTLALYYREPRAPSQAEVELIEACARVATIALEHGRAVEAIRAGELRHRLACSAVRGIVYDVDVATGRTFRSSGLLDVLGYDPETAPQGLEWWSSLIHPDDFPKPDLLEQDSFEVEYRAKHRDGHWVHLHDRAVAIRDPRGQVARWVGCSLDVTERKELERRLRHAKDVAESANLAKTEFLAQLCHEVRNPMAAVMGYLSMLEDDPVVRERVGPVLEGLRSCGDQIVRTLSDNLDLTKIEAGSIDLDLQEGDPWPLVLETVAGLRVLAERKGLTLEAVRAPGPRARGLKADLTRVRQVLTNLITNAVRFTERGGATVVLGARAQGPPRLVLTVKDTGLGIPSDRIERIFEPYYQAHAGAGRRFGGTGLGLSIAKKAALAMGGDLAVESAWGQGSSFEFTLPLRPQDLEPEDEALGPPPNNDSAKGPQSLAGRAWKGPPLRALIAEDSPDVQKIMAFYLRSFGADPVCVDDGAAAVALATAPGARFDVVFLDLVMPVMDGLAALKALKAQGFVPPVVVVSAAALKAQREACREAGCSAFLVKPVGREALAKALWEAVARGGPGATADE